MPGRVLVVSSDPARRRSFRDNLFLAGHAVFDVPNQSAALEACEDFSPSVVVVDLAGSRVRAERRALNKGGSSKASVNTELIRRLAKRFRSVRVVAICDGEVGSTPDEAVAAGARDYLREPVCIGELLVRVDKHLGISTKVKKLRRPAPRPRKKVDLRSLQPPRDALVSNTASDQLEAHASAEVSEVVRSAVEDTPDDADMVVSGNEVARRPNRLADLVPATGGAEATTLVWISLQGLDRVLSLGLTDHSTISAAVNSALDQFLPGATKWWVGSEAVAAFTGHLQSPVEASIEIKEAISDQLEKLGLAMDIALRVSATSRRWGEGRALFLARATGRISNGGLPVAPFSAESHPHPTVALPAEAARIRSLSTNAPSGTTPAHLYNR